MALRAVGAGVGRTGTTSLKAALEQLLDAPCYHMFEVMEHPEHLPHWQQAVDTGDAAWDEVFDGYGAAVDWPVASFYRELMNRYPDAVVILSTRDADGWWKSASSTIFSPEVLMSDRVSPEWRDMVIGMMSTRFSPALDDPEAMKAAYAAHNAAVRASVPTDRLLEWQPGDGWEPICAALELPVPVAPFPHLNTGDEFRSQFEV
jgi:hypothetical protein